MFNFPYFPFYTKDFLGDRKVASMSWAARGLYITLLCYAWDEEPRGYLPKSVVSNLVVTLTENERELLLSCFSEQGDQLFQKRMVEEAQKLAAKKQAQSEGGRRAALIKHNKNGDSKLLISDLELTNELHMPRAYDSDSISDSLGNRECREKGEDPNRFVPPRRSSTIDRKKPPFRQAGLFQREDVQAAIKDLLKYQEEKHGRQYSGIEFNSLLNRFEHITTAKEICRICDECISKEWKNPVFPDQAEYR